MPEFSVDLPPVGIELHRVRAWPRKATSNAHIPDAPAGVPKTANTAAPFVRERRITRTFNANAVTPTASEPR